MMSGLRWGRSSRGETREPVEEQGGGWRLRAARAQLGLTEEDLAHQVRRWAELHGDPRPDVTADTVLEWEGGTRAIDLKALRLLALALQVPDFERPGFAHLIGLNVWSLFRPAREFAEEDLALRREYLRYVAALGESSIPDPERLTTALDELSRVDSRLTENMAVVARRLPKQIEGLPLSPGRQRVHSQLQAIQALLDTPMPGAYRRELESAGAETATLAGMLSIPLGDHEDAALYLQLAMELAGCAGDRETEALALVFCSSLYSSCTDSRREDPARAREMLGSAIRLARHGVAARAFALLRQAEEYAILGEVADASRLMDEADRVVGTERGPVEGIHGRWDPNLHVAYRGNVARLSGRPERAIPLLETALAAQRPEAVPNRTRMTADLGAAYAQQGHVDHACHLLSEALQLTRAAGLPGPLPRIVRVRQRHLGRHAAEPMVRLLDEQLAGA